MDWSLRFQGVGNASAVELGSPMATIERDGAPWLTIDCGGEGLTAYLAHYREPPRALFVTHVHLDHVAGFERLFVGNYFDAMRRGRTRLYVPASVVPLLHRRVADYPNVLAEGGANFWDAFQLVPVGDAFWHDGLRLEVFPVRHHWPETAYGLRLRGSLVWSGDTRPIPEMLARHADANELIAHDCALHGNPSHSGIDDLEREYPRTVLDRCVLYHYASAADGQALAARGHRIASPGDVIALNAPAAGQVDSPLRPPPLNAILRPALPETDRAPQPLDRRLRPIRDLRLSVIDACNFRCGYCMPADRVPDDHGLDAASRMTFDEIETLVRGFARIGVHKLRITGGEPLLRKRLPELIARLARIPGIDDLALTTNGSLLARQAQALRDARLRRITISLDALDAGVFRALSGERGDLDAVLAGIAAAEAAGFDRLKFNCVVQRGINDDQVLPLVERFRGSGHIVRFIEYMDVGTCNGWDIARVVPSAELRDRLHARWPLHALDANYRGEVASRYAFDDGAGEVGFVSSVSAPFCGDCHRARVSADGQLFTCLFAGTGTPLRARLRDGEDAFAEHVAAVWTQRGDRYSELRGRATAPRKHVEMFLIGG